MEIDSLIDLCNRIQCTNTEPQYIKTNGQLCMLELAKEPEQDNSSLLLLLRFIKHTKLADVQWFNESFANALPRIKEVLEKERKFSLLCIDIIKLNWILKERSWTADPGILSIDYGFLNGISV